METVTRDECMRYYGIVSWYPKLMQEAWLCGRHEIPLSRLLIPQQARPVSYGQPLDLDHCTVAIHE